MGRDLVYFFSLGRPLLGILFWIVLGGARPWRARAMYLVDMVLLIRDGVHQVIWRTDEKSVSKANDGFVRIPLLDLNASSTSPSFATEVVPALTGVKWLPFLPLTCVIVTGGRRGRRFSLKNNCIFIALACLRTHARYVASEFVMDGWLSRVIRPYSFPELDDESEVELELSCTTLTGAAGLDTTRT